MLVLLPSLLIVKHPRRVNQSSVQMYTVDVIHFGWAENLQLSKPQVGPFATFWEEVAIAVLAIT